MANLVADSELVDHGDGTFGRSLERAWEIWGPNGGYMGALALRAAAIASHRARPANATVHFLGVASFDEPVTIVPTVLRSSKVATSVRVSVSQAGRPVLEAMVWAVDSGLQGLTHDYAEAPDVASWSVLPTIQRRLAASGQSAPPTRYAFWDNFEERPTTWIDDWEQRGPIDPDYRNWMRFEVGDWSNPWHDACRLLMLVDLGGWPAAERAHIGHGVIAPSIDVSCEFHRLDGRANWLLLHGVSPHASDGLIASHQQVWNDTGQLLASGVSHLLCRPLK